MSFIDIMWAIVSVFLALALIVSVGTFAVAATYLQVTEGGACRENPKC